MGLTLGNIMIFYLYPEDRGSKFLQKSVNFRQNAHKCLSSLKKEVVSPSETFAHFRQTA